MSVALTIDELRTRKPEWFAEVEGGILKGVRREFLLAIEKAGEFVTIDPAQMKKDHAADLEWLLTHELIANESGWLVCTRQGRAIVCGQSAN